MCYEESKTTQYVAEWQRGPTLINQKQSYYYTTIIAWASLVAQMVKDLPVM